MVCAWAGLGAYAGVSIGGRKAAPYDATVSGVTPDACSSFASDPAGLTKADTLPGNSPELRFAFQNDEFGRGPPQSSADNAEDPEVTASWPHLLLLFPESLRTSLRRKLSTLTGSTCHLLSLGGTWEMRQTFDLRLSPGPGSLPMNCTSKPIQSQGSSA